MNEPPPFPEETIQAWGSLSKADYLAAAKLFVRVRPGRAKELVVGIVFLSLGTFLALSYLVSSDIAILPIFLIAFGGIYLFRNLYLPYQLARIYAASDKQEEIHWNITAQHYGVRTRHVRATTEWPGFVNAMANDQVLVLFPTKLMMHVIPLRFFSDPNDITSVLSWAKQAGVPVTDLRKAS